MMYILVFISFLFVGADETDMTSNKLGWNIKNESDLSLVVSTGNTESDTYSLRQSNQLQKGKDIVRLRAQFLRTKTADVETGKYWLWGLRYERELNKRLNAFIGYQVESDIYALYSKRKSSDIGLKYFIKKSNNNELFIELNYRHTQETDLAANKDSDELVRSYIEWNRKWTEDFSTKVWIEHLQDVDTSKEYFLNYEASTSFTMTRLLSLKLAYLTKYNNRPNLGAQKTDRLYTTSLVASF